MQRYSLFMHLFQHRTALKKQAGLISQAKPALMDGITPNLREYTVGISLCGRNSFWQEALLFFESMPRVRLSPNVISYSAAISAYEQGGQWQEALVLLEVMSKATICSNVISYNAAISACLRGVDGSRR